MREYLGKAANHNDTSTLYTYGWVGLVGELPRLDNSDGV